MTLRNQIIISDATEGLRTLPEKSVHCVVTSPPYWGLRDYGVDGQIGLEKTPEEYVARILAVFREVWRVLRDDGTLWLNLGDSYATGAGRVGKCPGGGKQGKQPEYLRPRTQPNRMPIAGLKPKDLVGIPWRVAFALQADGWYLRQDIIWAKPNPMPESVRDRCTKSHEYIFLLTKSAKYYYDNEAIKEPAVTGWNGSKFDEGKTLFHQLERPQKNRSRSESPTRNKRSVWTVAPKAFKKAHFATFPPALIEPCILAGTSKAGCCPDCGAQWKRVVNRTKMGKALSKRRAALGDKGATCCSGKMTSPPKSKTIGWAPTCKCYDHLYWAEFPKSTSARKREQRDLSGDWRRRVRKRPGKYSWDRDLSVVLDPFRGSGTTEMVADENGRRSIGIELNPDYAKMRRGK